MNFAQRQSDRLAIRGASREFRNAHIHEIALDGAAIGEKNAADEGRSDRSGIEICAAFEAMTGVGVQAMTSRGTTDSHGLEPCGFYEHIPGVGSDHRVPAAHDAGEAQRLDMVRDHKIFGIKNAVACHQGS